MCQRELHQLRNCILLGGVNPTLKRPNSLCPGFVAAPLKATCGQLGQVFRALSKQRAQLLFVDISKGSHQCPSKQSLYVEASLCESGRSVFAVLLK